MRGWLKSQRALCCISAQAWQMAWRICTTPAGRSVPIINLVGQHATYHLRHDTPLVSDIEGDRQAIFQMVANVSLVD